MSAALIAAGVAAERRKSEPPPECSMEAHIQELLQSAVDEDKPPVYLRFSDRPACVIIIAVAIIFNAIQMGMELQFTGSSWKTVFKVAENFFTAFFLVELCIKNYMDTVKDYWSQRANLLDAVIVVMAIIDNWLLSLFLSDEDKDSLSFLSVIKLVRLGRILKLLKMKRELAVLVESILNSLSSMVWLSVLLGILIYMVAICCVQFVGRSKNVYPKDDFDVDVYFGDMTAAAMTGLNMAMLQEFGEIMRPMLKYQPVYCLGMLLYVGVASFGIMNAIIGVIVTKTSDAQSELDKENESAFRKRQMAFVASVQDIIYAIDLDGDGTVSPEEIEAASDNVELKEVLENIDLPFQFQLGDLHCMLDKDGDGELSKAEFFTGMRRLIFSNDFHRQCLLSLSISQQKRKLFETRLEMDESFVLVNRKLDALLENAGIPPILPEVRQEDVHKTGSFCFNESPPDPPANEDEANTVIKPVQEVVMPVETPLRPVTALSQESTRPGTSTSIGGGRDRLREVEQSMSVLKNGLNQKFDSLGMDRLPVTSPSSLALRDAANPYCNDLALLEDDYRLNARKITDQLAQMQNNFAMLNQNMQWMRGAIQTNAPTITAAQTGLGKLGSAGPGPYTIAVTGASLVIQTPNLPNFAQSNTRPKPPPQGLSPSLYGQAVTEGLSPSAAVTSSAGADALLPGADQY